LRQVASEVEAELGRGEAAQYRARLRFVRENLRREHNSALCVRLLKGKVGDAVIGSGRSLP
jgi:hypothetical protein